MQSPRYFVFEPFRLDVLDERLWRHETNVPLGQKALAVLHHLVRNSGQLTTKDDLISAVWPDTSVTDASLATAIREIRRALGDPARIPQFIETVHRRGYRFIAQVAETDALAPRKATPLSTGLPVQSASTSCTVPSRCFVGRENELVQLGQWYAAAQQGSRRVVFVAGEAGIGKTELIETFLSAQAVREGTLVARGQCIEHYGSGEAYLPLLEALGRLGRDVTLHLVDTLHRYAPSWLVHLPSLSPEQRLADPTPVRPEKMLRELAEALEVLARERTLIFIVEDLHWSDTSTLEMLAYVARRRDPARLLVIVTYRPLEAALQRHPLRKLLAELRTHPQCSELVLDYLSKESLEHYLLQRCGSHPYIKEFADVLCRRTGGLPLFFSAIVDELKQRCVDQERMEPRAVAQIIPSTVRQLIEHRFEQLPEDDRTILEAASVVGDTFSVAAIAAAMSQPEENIDTCCSAWTREGLFLSSDNTSGPSDETARARYRFRHALIQEVIYSRIAPERRAQLHRLIGCHLEVAYRNRASAIAAELAVHFEQGRELRRAFLYTEQAARNALQRSAYSEALRHVTRAQDIFSELPERGRARLRRELDLLLLRGHVLKTTNGWGTKEVEHIYDRARDLSKALSNTPCLLQALWGLTGATFVKSELRRHRPLSQELLTIARKRHDSISCVAGHMQLGGNAFMLGKLSIAHTHFRHADSFYDVNQHRAHIAAFGADMGLFSRIWETHLTWIEGHPDRARAAAEKTVNLARELSHPFTQVITLAYAAMLQQFLKDLDVLERLAEETISLSSEHGFSYYLAWAEILRGWCRAARGNHHEAIAEIRHGIQVLQSTAGVRLPYYLGLLAEACSWAGRFNEGLQALDDAFAIADRTGERIWQAELYRLKGELVLAANAPAAPHQAELEFLKALKIARNQDAKLLVLRAAISIGRLWSQTQRLVEARAIVAEVRKDTDESAFQDIIEEDWLLAESERRTA